MSHILHGGNRKPAFSLPTSTLHVELYSYGSHCTEARQALDEHLVWFYSDVCLYLTQGRSNFWQTATDET